MKKTTYHILNGDALKHQLDDVLTGEVIIARECLVDGPVTGENLEELYKIRSSFLNDNYGLTSLEDYKEKVVIEFEKIQNIPNGSDITLWFEDDLFCQVNMWFVLHLLQEAYSHSELYLVRPTVHTRYGFGGFSQKELREILENRIELSRLDDLSKFWGYYQDENLELMRQLAKELHGDYPFLLAAVEAHIARIPAGDYQGRPVELILEIITELNTTDFSSVFSAFCERAPIYGFGDLQVKRLMNNLA